MNLIFIIISFVISACIARIIIPRILMISLRKKLFDMPDNRKVHKRAIPRLGGVAFFPTILFSCCFVLVLRSLLDYHISGTQSQQVLQECLLLICGMVLLYLTGIADDLMGIRYRQKFIIQIICASFFPIAGLWINDLYGLLGIHLLPAWFGIPFTILVTVFITNAINLIDGIDGLASGLSSVALLVFCVLFINKSLWLYSTIAISTFGVLVPFFYYNVFGSAERARKIFMGDTGSLTLGYILSFLAIKYSQNNLGSYTEGAITIAFSTLIIPSFDVIRVIFVRIRNKKSPFEADKNHIHHKFLLMGFTSRKTMILLLIISCLFSSINILLTPYINNNLILLTDILVWSILNLWWDKKVIKYKNR